MPVRSPVYTLVIGNRNYSSWSLRAWLYMRVNDLSFEEVRVPLFADSNWRERLRRYSPAGLVPVLKDGPQTVWDSLAIMEYLNDTNPGPVGWPASRPARAMARAISAEMHSGLAALRQELPMNIRARRTVTVSAEAAAQVERVLSIWTGGRELFANHGPWLCGELSIADIMFAPVVLRFQSYGFSGAGSAAGYMEQVLSWPALVEWQQAAAAEAETIAEVDGI